MSNTGKNKQAANMLRAFINQVTDLISEGMATPEGGQALIALTNRAIASIAFI